MKQRSAKPTTNFKRVASQFNLIATNNYIRLLQFNSQFKFGICMIIRSQHHFFIIIHSFYCIFGFIIIFSFNLNFFLQCFNYSKSKFHIVSFYSKETKLPAIQFINYIQSLSFIHRFNTFLQSVIAIFINTFQFNINIRYLFRFMQIKKGSQRAVFLRFNSTNINFLKM